MAPMRRRHRGRAALLHLVVSAAITTTALSAKADETPAPAATPLLDLAWSAPPECPDKDHVVAEVADLVGPRHPGQRPLTARGTISSRPSPRPYYALELVVGGEAKPRTMTGVDCARLASAAALVLALDIDPGALEREAPAPAAPSGEEPAPPPAGVPPTATPTPTPTRKPGRRRPVVHPRRPRPSFEATLGPRFVLDVGSLPRETAAAGAAFSIAREALALEVQGTGYGRRFTTNGPRNGAGGAYVDLLSLAAHGCARSLVARVEWRGCLGGELGREATRGISIAQPASSSSVWGAISAVFRARAWPDRVVSPTVGVVVGTPVTAPRVVIDGFQTVFEPPVVFVRAFLGIEAKLF